MNTRSINNIISKELGLVKSEVIKGYAQICNRQGICYAYRTTRKYSGDFHCRKWSGHYYMISFDSGRITDEVKDKIVALLVSVGCEDVSKGSDIIFKIAD